MPTKTKRSSDGARTGAKRSHGKPTDKPSDPRRRSARNAKPPTKSPTKSTIEPPAEPPTESATAFVLDPESADLIPAPRPLVARRLKPATTPSGRFAARNILEALGGPQPVAELMRLSGQTKAIRLAELLDADDPVIEKTSFQYKLNQAGLSLSAFTELLLDVRGSRVLARLVSSADEVAESIISRATDQIVEHRDCLASGRILKELEDRSMVPTEFECFDCQGSGYVLKSAEKEWVDLYLELVRLRKNAPMVALTKNVTNQQLNVHGDLITGDGAPAIDMILKRADEQRIALPPHQTNVLPDASEQVRIPAMSGMPEDAVDDEVVEAVVVGEAKV